MKFLAAKAILKIYPHAFNVAEHFVRECTQMYMTDQSVNAKLE